jgi:hypothetical protein
MKDPEKLTKIGNFGQNEVANYFSNEGFKVIPAPDPYDRSKDLTVVSPNGNSYDVEVKTQQLYIKGSGFTITPKQLEKCSDVDLLIFVELPHHSNDNSARIWVSKKANRTYKTVYIGVNGKQILFPIKTLKLISNVDLDKNTVLSLNSLDQSYARKLNYRSSYTDHANAEIKRLNSEKNKK